MIKVSYSFTPGELGKGFQSMYLPMADAAKEAIAEAGEIAKREGRASIRDAGFSTKWQNTLRVDVYPKGSRTSVEAAAVIYHKIFYAGVFEEGTTIKSTGLMWLPFKTTPTPRRGNALASIRRASPEPLQFFKSKKGTPLLAVQVRLSGSKSRQETPKLSLAAIRRGKKGKGTLRTIPVFHGVNQVKMPKKFSITQAVDRARLRVAELYFKYLKDR